MTLPDLTEVFFGKPYSSSNHKQMEQYFIPLGDEISFTLKSALVFPACTFSVRGFRCLRSLFLWLCLLPASGLALDIAPADYLVSIVRHGDRSPRGLGDQYHLWPAGSGQLTPLGMSQMVSLGQEIRQHYFGASISKVWTFNLSHHFAKGSSRTIQSASALLQGFYPAADTDTGLPGSIQLPPVFSSPVEKDWLFASQHNCPGYVHRIQALEQSPRWVAKKKEYGDRFEHWQRIAGVEGGIYSLALLMDRVTIHTMHNLPLPSGISRDDARLLSELLDWLLLSIARERDLAQLVLAPLVTKILANFRQAAHCLSHPQGSTTPCTRWTLYLGSDINLNAMLSLLGVPQERNVRYGAHLEMKLNWDDASPRISIFFNHAPLEVPGCGTSCRLDTWLEILDNIQPACWEALCSLNSGPVLNQSNLSHPLPDGQRPKEINKN